jgi:protein phosphatase PTC4
MGQFFSYPITTEDVVLSNNVLSVAQTKGYRLKQEDYFSVNEYFNIPFQITDDNIQKIANLKIMGVFDGHGGHLTSEYLEKHLNQRLLRSMQNCDNDKGKGEKAISSYETNHSLIIQRIKNAFWELDIELYEYLKDDVSGSTAILCVIINDKDLYSVNLGDSRLIMGTNGSLKVLSFDHKPNHIGELIRINENGGFIQNNRVQGILALARSFGDFDFKIGDNLYETAVIVEPEIIYHEIDYDKDDFIFLGSDGVFEIFNNRQLVKAITKELKTGINPKDILKKIINETMANANNETGCGFDNMTTILYQFDKLRNVAS